MTGLSSSGILIRAVIEEPLLEICRIVVTFCRQPRDSPMRSWTDLGNTDQGITFKIRVKILGVLALR